MKNKTEYQKRIFDCPVTGKTETAIIERITDTIKSNRSSRANKFSFVRESIDDCTGLENCGVRTSHRNSFTYSWDRCPLMPTLNKGR